MRCSFFSSSSRLAFFYVTFISSPSLSPPLPAESRCAAFVRCILSMLFMCVYYEGQRIIVLIFIFIYFSNLVPQPVCRHFPRRMTWVRKAEGSWKTRTCEACHPRYNFALVSPTMSCLNRCHAVVIFLWCHTMMVG